MSNPRIELPYTYLVAWYVMHYPSLMMASHTSKDIVHPITSHTSKEVNVFNLGKQIMDMDNQTFEVNSTENLTSEHEESLEPDTESEFDLKSEDFNLDQIIESVVDWTSSPNVPIPKFEHQLLPSNASTPFLELKALPEHLKYAYLGGKETLLVITTSHLTGEQEESLCLL